MYNTANSIKNTIKVLPSHITSYDILKTIAIVLMIVDHIGVYFYPDETWFRIFGRFCVPIWFFLIGYARTREISLKILAGAVVILLGNMIAGETVFPLCVLVSLMVGRYFIDTWMGAGRRGGEALAGLYFILLLLSLPTSLVFEYGTLCFLFTVFGAMCRYRQDMPQVRQTGYDGQVLYFMMASFFAFIVMQSVNMDYLSRGQFYVLVSGMVPIGYLLWNFKPVDHVRLTQIMPRFVGGVIRFTGRRTLEIYVVHLLVFKALALILYPDRFQIWNWSFASEGAVEFVKYIINI